MRLRHKRRNALLNFAVNHLRPPTRRPPPPLREGDRRRAGPGWGCGRSGTEVCEVCASVRRDLLVWQKRPMDVAKEAY